MTSLDLYGCPAGRRMPAGLKTQLEAQGCKCGGRWRDRIKSAWAFLKNRELVFLKNRAWYQRRAPLKGPVTAALNTAFQRSPSKRPSHRCHSHTPTSVWVLCAHPDPDSLAPCVCTARANAVSNAGSHLVVAPRQCLTRTATPSRCLHAARCTVSWWTQHARTRISRQS